VSKLRYYYNRFIGAVAKGRGMKLEEVDAVGRGRVWTGTQAKDKKLVDRMGGIVDAVVEAKKRAGLGDDDTVHVINLPEAPAGLLQQALGLIGGQAASETTGLAELPILADLLRILPGSLLFGADGRPQARLPFAIVIE
jgi:protease-4